jgi:hypothetical protein
MNNHYLCIKQTSMIIVIANLTHNVILKTVLVIFVKFLVIKKIATANRTQTVHPIIVLVTIVLVNLAVYKITYMDNLKMVVIVTIKKSVIVYFVIITSVLSILLE